MHTVTSKWIAALFLAGFACVVGCAPGAPEESEPSDAEESVAEAEQGVRGGKPICALKCAAPPDGCHYENAVLTGPCNKLTCGTLVCDGGTI